MIYLSKNKVYQHTLSYMNKYAQMANIFSVLTSQKIYEITLWLLTQQYL